MQNLSLLLTKLENLVMEWEKNSKDELLYFTTIKMLLSEMTENRNFPSDQKDKVVDCNWNIDSMFNINTGNGHSFEQHQKWFLGNISNIQSTLKF